MGIDKKNVRYVLHASLAKSLEGVCCVSSYFNSLTVAQYYQEAGRAGRDGEFAECTIFYKCRDVPKLERIIRGFGQLKRRGKRFQRDIDRLDGVRRYCENTARCRRKSLLTHFNGSAVHRSESPQAAVLPACCDICERKAKVAIPLRNNKRPLPPVLERSQPHSPEQHCRRHFA